MDLYVPSEQSLTDLTLALNPFNRLKNYLRLTQMLNIQVLNPDIYQE